jgi:smoothened protein
MEKKGAYFHLVAWSSPLVLTITTMALGEIDGNSVAGICFVGYVNPEYRAGFLLLPLIVALSIGTYFMAKGWFILYSLLSSSL